MTGNWPEIRVESGAEILGSPAREIVPGVHYQADFLPPAQADDYLHRLIGELPWEQHHIRLFGRRQAEPRLTVWYGRGGIPYRYSGSTRQSVKNSKILNDLIDLLNRRLAADFNGVLVNYYRHGQDSMGWHADDEPELGADPLIASVSLGGVRRFSLRARGATRTRCTLALEHGSLLLMSGDCQQRWQHALPKTRQAVAPRVNLSFRRIQYPADKS